MAKSFKPEVIADSSGKWCSNALRFATIEEAQASADNLAGRWFAVREWRATECEDPVTHAWRDGGLVDIRTPDAAPYYAPASVSIENR
jgi:hypothetical protein